MSTWHGDEPLEEAIWFFIWSAFPFDTEIPATSYLAVSVGSTDRLMHSTLVRKQPSA